MKIVQLQFLKLPRKIQVTKNDCTRLLGKEHYGNVDLVKEWKTPFMPSVYEIKEFPAETSVYEFPYNIVDFVDKAADLDGKKENLRRIYACCLLYELLTIGDYVPNLYSDIINVFPVSDSDELRLSNYCRSEPFAFILLAMLETDFSNIFLDYFLERLNSKLKEPNSKIYEVLYTKDWEELIAESEIYSPENVLELGVNFEFCPNIDVKSWCSLSLLTTSINYIEISDDWKNETATMDTTMMEGIFLLYYNAGGGYYDVVKINFSLDESNRNRVIVTRNESRDFY